MVARRQVEKWRDATADPLLEHAHGLDPAAETLVLTGSVAVTNPGLFIQGDDIGACRSWLARVPHS